MAKKTEITIKALKEWIELNIPKDWDWNVIEGGGFVLVNTPSNITLKFSFLPDNDLEYGSDGSLLLWWISADIMIENSQGWFRTVEEWDFDNDKPLNLSRMVNDAFDALTEEIDNLRFLTPIVDHLEDTLTSNETLTKTNMLLIVDLLKCRMDENVK